MIIKQFLFHNKIAKQNKCEWRHKETESLCKWLVWLWWYKFCIDMSVSPTFWRLFLPTQVLKISPINGLLLFLITANRYWFTAKICRCWDQREACYWRLWNSASMAGLENCEGVAQKLFMRFRRFWFICITNHRMWWEAFMLWVRIIWFSQHENIVLAQKWFLFMQKVYPSTLHNTILAVMGYSPKAKGSTVMKFFECVKHFTYHIWLNHTDCHCSAFTDVYSIRHF